MTTLKQALQHVDHREYDKAKKLCQEILAAHPGHPEALQVLGAVAYQQRQIEQAIDYIQQAIAARPDLAGAHKNLGVAYMASGKFAQAAEAFCKALELKPHFAEAMLCLAQIDHGERQLDNKALLRMILPLVNSQHVSQTDQCVLEFAAGKLYNDLKSYGEAFKHYQRANMLKGMHMDWPRTLEQLRSSKQHINKSLIDENSLTHNTTQPMFIVGMPRSGTTLVERILASHPDVSGVGETPYMNRIAYNLPNYGASAPYPECMKHMPKQVYTEAARAYSKEMGHLACDENVVTADKTPANFLHLGLINILFPRGRIIHCKRNPLDTGISCYCMNFASGNEFAFDLRDIGRYYQVYRQYMEHWQSELTVPIFNVDYEDLVKRPTEVCAGLFEFCELDFSPHNLEPRAKGHVIATGSIFQARQPIYENSVGRWRDYEEYLDELKEGLAEVLPI